MAEYYEARTRGVRRAVPLAGGVTLFIHGPLDPGTQAAFEDVARALTDGAPGALAGAAGPTGGVVVTPPDRRTPRRGADQIGIQGTPSMQRVGALPAGSRIAAKIEHDRAIRQRLIAAIHDAAGRAGLNAARLAALLERLTGSRDPSDLVLDQLRRVLGELRTASPRSVEHPRGDAAADVLGASAAAPSPSSTPAKDT